jgi:hypothetical protein
MRVMLLWFFDPLNFTEATDWIAVSITQLAENPMKPLR